MSEDENLSTEEGLINFFSQYFRKRKITEEEIKSRLDTCNDCDRLIKTVNVCKECGCFMNIKTKFLIASCPLNKWGPI